MALSNFTSPDVSSAGNGPNTNLDNSLNPAQMFDVTLNMPELANLKSVRFLVHRSNSNVNNIPAGTVIMHNSQVTIKGVGPWDLITLRSGRG